MRAAFKGRTDAVRDLVGRGADVDAADAEGYTALHCAAEAGRADVVDVLLKNGANARGERRPRLRPPRARPRWFGFSRRPAAWGEKRMRAIW
jgi:hypothetical protein